MSATNYTCTGSSFCDCRSIVAAAVTVARSISACLHLANVTPKLRRDEAGSGAGPGRCTRTSAGESWWSNSKQNDTAVYPAER